MLRTFYWVRSYILPNTITFWWHEKWHEKLITAHFSSHLAWYGNNTFCFYLDCVRLLTTPGKTTRRSVKMLKSPLSPQLKRQTSSSGRIQDHVLKSSNNPKLLGNKICCWKLYVCLCFLSVIYYLSSCFFSLLVLHPTYTIYNLHRYWFELNYTIFSSILLKAKLTLNNIITLQMTKRHCLWTRTSVRRPGMNTCSSRGHATQCWLWA